MPTVAPLLASLALVAFCRFTVRDVAFVDLGDHAYRLHLTAPAEHQGLRERMESLAQTILSDTNVTARFGTGPLAARLVGPDERVLDLDVTELATSHRKTSYRKTGSAWLERLVSSRAREAIIAAVTARYCVVVIAEGTDAAANARAHAAVKAAFAELARIFDRMPKDVGGPPITVTVGARDASERVLLWSLGVEADAHPEIAVVFGRGRRVGPRLSGAGITKESLFRILHNVGQSCECELPRSWMRGERLPLRWSEATRRTAAERLGFDPESPLVRTEVTAILARGPGGRREEAPPSVEEMLLGYEEEPVGIADDAKAELATKPAANQSSEVEADDAPAVFGNTVTALLAVLIVSVLTGAALLLRNRL